MSAPGTPGSVWPHYTFGANEYGWVVRDAVDGNNSPGSFVYAICYNPNNPMNNNVAAIAPSGCITGPGCKTFSVNFTRTYSSPMRAVSVDVQLSPELVLCGATPIEAGSIWNGWGEPYGIQMQVLNPALGLYRVDIAVLGGDCGPTTGGELFTINVAKAPGVTVTPPVR